MSETVALYAPGDYLYVRDVGGQLSVYIVRSDGTLTLIQSPKERL
jgi:hypothetical protein